MLHTGKTIVEIHDSANVHQAAMLMESYGVSSLLVYKPTFNKKEYIGFVDIKDLIKVS